MALGLHPNCKNRLVELLAKSLPRVQVDNGKFLNFGSTYSAFEKIDHVIPDGVLKDRLTNYIADFPVSAFIRDILATGLAESGHYDKDAPSTPITTLDSFKDARRVAQSLVNKLDSLPWQCSLVPHMCLSPRLPNFKRFYLCARSCKSYCLQR